MAEISKRDAILLLGVIPGMKTGSTFLAWKDPNSTGLDDVIAEMLRLNADILERYIMTGSISDEMAAKLPPHLAAKLK
jgi:hypothetical protein